MFVRRNVGTALLFFLLAACSQASNLPTRVPTAQITDEPAPTDTPRIPPTRDLSQPQVTVTRPPTVVFPTRRPTSTPEPSVNITSPANGAELVAGSQVVASGLVQLGASQTLSVTLVSATGHHLADASAVVSEVNSWQASLVIPQSVTGQAQLRAMLQDIAGDTVAADVESVDIVLDTDSTDQYLALLRPLMAESAVAGFNLFFDGLAQRPVNNVVTISLWTEECQTQVARQSFTLSGSGYWQGFLVVPRDVRGTVCAVAHFGAPGEESWREAQVRMNVLAPDDDNAQGVLVGNPPPGSVTLAGQPLLLYGTAYNANEDQVLVSVLLENGRILSEGVATVDFFGYWELELFIPEDAAGPAQVNITTGAAGQEGYAQNQNLISIRLPQ